MSSSPRTRFVSQERTGANDLAGSGLVSWSAWITVTDSHTLPIECNHQGPRRVLSDVRAARLCGKVVTVAVATAERRFAGERSELGYAIRTGALWGVIGAAVMAIYAMIAGLTYLNSGFFTPLYHIASSVIEPKAMMTSMQKATEGQTAFHFTLGPAAVGVMIHLTTGAAYGIVFALVARSLRLSGGTAIIAGALYGGAVLLFSSFVGLPIAAALFDGGNPIADMPRMIGWTTFTIEHMIFGVILGIGWLITTRTRAISL